MSDNQSISRKSYLTKNMGDYTDTITLGGQAYKKQEDLRYGTNPHQTAALYVPADVENPIGDMQMLKSGKSGLSQTNLEDISYALNICKYFDRPACACMKHVNPSGAAVSTADEPLAEVFKKARDCDARAAFGCVTAFNTTVDADTARAIMSTFVECVVAPDFTEEALAIFNDSESFGMNKHIRILKCGDLTKLPRFTEDNHDRYRTFKTLHDGSVIIADPLLTNVRSVEDLKPASGANKKFGEVTSTQQATAQQLDDLLIAWYIGLNVRSNSVVLVKDGATLAVGTGEQDRVGAVEQAIWKYENKFEGPSDIKGGVMASDGFFPFADAIETAAEHGIKAVASPAGSLKDAEVISRANELGVALVHTPERIFSHH